MVDRTVYTIAGNGSGIQNSPDGPDAKQLPIYGPGGLDVDSVNNLVYFS